MKQKGFTLAEILLVLVTVGVIMVLTIQTVAAQRSNFAFSCYHFFRDLKITIGHMGASTVNGGLNSFNCDQALDVDDATYQACVADGKSGTANTYLVNYNTGTGFCKGLASAMSTASKIKCTDADLNTATLNNVYGNIANGQSENFRLMNGYLIYVSNKNAASGTGQPYRIVSVDLNGNNSPNTTGKDIISFAVFDNGEVLPVGEAATSTNHFIAVIKMKNILEMPESNAQTVINSMRHPAAIIKTSDKKPLSFKDAYCKVFGSSSADPMYCSGYTSFDEKFKFTFTEGESTSTVDVPVTICTQAQYNSDGTVAQKVNNQDFVAECEFNVVKPQISKLIPTTQDVYSSVNNEEDTDEESGTANQIYKY